MQPSSDALGMMGGVLLAQAGPDLPLTIPWYFGVVIFGVWATAMVGLVVLGRRWLQLRAERRAFDARSKRPIRGGPPARR